MPNWCNNTLIVTGDKIQLSKFLSKVHKPKFEVIVKKDEVEKYHAEKLLLETAKKYKANIKRFIEIQNMNSEDFLIKILLCDKNKNGDFGYEPNNFTFEGTVPTPRELYDEGLHTYGGSDANLHDTHRAKMQKIFGYDNSNDFHIGEWGTKWNACEPIINQKDENVFNVSFDTAWSPPIPWLQKTALMFPLLKFELNYREDGCGFRGTSIAQGEDFSDENGKIPTCSKCGWYLDHDGECENEDCEENPDYEQSYEEENKE